MSVKLYKYRAFSTSEDQERAFQIISKREFWFSEASLVNDPFEFRCAINLWQDLEKSARIFAIIERMHNPETTPEEALEKARRVLQKIPSNKLLERQWELSYNLWKEFARTVTMCCFAGVPDSILMWSHYASNHTGICIEVEPIGLEKVVFPVKYSDEVPQIDIEELIYAKKALFDQLFLRKASCWLYEKEYRIMVARRGGLPISSHARKFAEGAIKRVIVGCVMPQENYKRLSEWLRLHAPDVKLAIAGPSSESKYKLEIGNVDDLFDEK